MTINSSSGHRWTKVLALAFGAMSICALSCAVYEEIYRKPRLFYLPDDNHFLSPYSDKCGTFVFFDFSREFVVVIVTENPELRVQGNGSRELTYHDATLFKGTRYETKVTEAQRQLLVCFPDKRLEFPISKGALTEWIMTLKLPPDGSLEDLNLLREMGRMLHPQDQKELEKEATLHSL